MTQKAKQPALTQLIGRIRKSPQDATYAVNWAKHAADENLLKQMIDHLVGGPQSKLITGDNPFPFEYADIHSRIPRLKCSTDPLIELRWNLMILSKFKSKLKQYVALRSRFGANLLLGDYANAENNLNEIELKISKSLWSLDKKLLLLQYSGGFVANKEFLGSLHNTCRNQYVNLMALFFSIRVERAIDLFSYQHLVDSKLTEIEKHGDSATAAYFRSVLLAEIPFDVDHASYILFRSNDASIIDRLNATTRFLRQLMLRPSGTHQLLPFQPLIHRLAISTMEPTLLAIDRNISINANTVLPENYGQFLSALDFYTSGEYTESIPIIRSFIEHNPTSFGPYLVCAKAYARLGISADQLGEPFSISSQIIDSLTRIMTGKGDVRERILKLLGIAVDLGENHLAFGLTNYVFELIGRPDSQTAALTELSSKFPNPMTESNAPEGAKRLEALIELYPESLTLQFLDCRSRRSLTEEGKDLPVSSTRLVFYTAEEQILLGNKSIGIPILEDLYASSESYNNRPFVELRQIAVALFDAYVADGKLLQACELATRSYINNDILSSSLDFSTLLQELNKNPLEGGNGSIYLPVITFLSGASEYVVYKALDRFLSSHSCKRMSHLLPLCEHFPADAFAVLVGEIMTEDVMALGWRYTDDYADMEAQRIEVCAFLVSSQERKAKEYAEEAKSIIKRQSVRQTLQHVSASKLRVDVLRMKRLYKETLEPIYNRRQLFINAEKNGKLVQIETDHLIRAAMKAENSELQEGDKRPIVTTELSQESNNLLYLLLDHCYGLFLWTADCSLNFLLSAEIRHGFLKNHLRKPFQTHNVILSKASMDGEYRNSDYWLRQLEGNVTAGDLTAIEVQFREFSSNIDDHILSLNNKVVQIRISAIERGRLEDIGMGDRLKGTDVGFFDYTSFYEKMLGRIKDLDDANTFDAFSDVCFGELEQLTERNLSNVSDYFRIEVPKIIREACDQLVEGLRKHIDKPYLWTTLLTAVQSARDGAISEANEIAGWFQPAQEVQPTDTNLGEMVDVVATLLRSCHPKALGACSISFSAGGERVAVAGGAFSAVFDALYILLQNVSEHAGIPPDEVDCQIYIGIDSNSAVIEVSNNVVDEVSAARNEEAALRSLLGQLTPIAEGEGKSGLKKINRILFNAVGERAPELHVSRVGCRFSVKLVLPSGCTHV